MYMPENCNLEDVAHIKKFVDIPVVCAGRMDPEAGAKAIAEGRIDAMGVARQFLVDGEWVTKLIEDRLEEIKPCICCHNGCFNFSSSKGHANTQDLTDTMGLARCALNPKTMQSKKYKIKPALFKRKIAVVGGGIGGMEAAIVCAQRGHKVVLYEKTDKLGGVFNAAAAPSFKEKDKALLAWYNREIRSYPNIEIKLNTTVKNYRKLKVNDVILATGAKTRKLDINGKHKFVDAIDYLLGNKEVGERVVIVGGGLTGCEIAYDLYLKGKKPIIVEGMDDLIVTKGVPLANTSYLRDFFKTNKVPVHLNTSITQIVDRGAMVKHLDTGKYETIPCDSVILSIGYNSVPDTDLSVYMIGDAKKVGNLRTVIWDAWNVATRI
jgi:2-enoate reductase